MGELSQKRRLFTRKRLIIASAILLPVVVLLLLRTYLHSQAFYRVVANELRRTALEQGLDLEIGSFRFNWDSYTATAENLRIHNRANGLMVADLDILTLSLDLENMLSERTLHLKEAYISGLNVYYTIDTEGRSSLDGLAKSRDSGGLIETDGFRLKLDGFVLHYSDPSFKADVSGHSQIRFRGSKTEIDIEGDASRLALATGTLQFRYRLKAELEGDRLTLESLKVDSEHLQVGTSGTLDSSSYDLKFSSVADLEILTLFTPERLAGRVDLSGRIKGKGLDYLLEAQLQSPQISTSSGIFDLSIDRITLSPHEQAVRVVLEGLKIARFSSSQAVATAISSNHLVLELGRQTDLSARELLVGQVTSRGFAASQIRIRDIAASLQGGTRRIQAEVAIDAVAGRGVKAERIEAALELVEDKLEIDALNARLADGRVRASGWIVLKGGSGRVDIDYDGLQLARLVQNQALAESTLNGRVRVDLKERLSVRVDGRVTTHKSGLQGDYSLGWDGSTVHLDRLELNTSRSQVAASGAISEKATSVAFKVDSDDAAELQALALNYPQLKTVLEPVLEYHPQLLGSLNIEGTVSGSLQALEVEANVKLGQIALNQEVLGSVTARVRADSSATYASATILQGDGVLRVEAKVTKDLRLATARLHLERIRVEHLLKAASINALSERFEGILNAEVALDNLSLKDFTSQGRIELHSDEMTFSGRNLRELTLLLKLNGNEILIEKLDTQLNLGHLHGSGRVDSLQQSFQFEIETPRLDLSALAQEIGLDGLKVTGIAQAQLQLQGNLKELDRVELNLRVTTPSMLINDKSAGAVTLSAVTHNNRLDIDLITNIAGKPQPLKATVDLADEFRTVSAEANFANIDIADLAALYDPTLVNYLKGRVTGRVKLRGPTLNEFGENSFDKMEGSLEIERLSLAVAGQEIPVVTPVSLRLRSKRIESAIALKGRGADLLLDISLQNIYEKPLLNLKLKGTLAIEQMDLVDRASLGGRLLVDVGLSGSLEDPKLAGEVRLRKFFLGVAGLPIEIERGNARLEFQGDRVLVKTLRARSGEGYILGTGSVRLERLRPVEWSLDLETDALQTYYRGVSAQLVARLKLDGSPTQQVIRGHIEIPQAEYQSDFDLGEILAESGRTFSPLELGFTGQSLLPPTKLDIEIEASDSLLVRNRQLNTIGSARLNLSGDIDSPQLTGLISLEGGSIVFRKQKYTIEQGTLQFADGAAPYLTLLAESRISDYDISLSLHGSIDKLEVDLRSEPSLSRSEILSLITTGKLDSGTLNTQDIVSSGVSSAASLLSEKLISKQAERLLGLSSFRVDPVLKPNSNPAARVTISKKLGRDLELTYSTNLSSEQEQTGIVEYNLSSRFSALASITQGGTGTSSSQSDTSFLFEMRGRKRFALGYKPILAPVVEKAVASRLPKVVAEVIVERTDIPIGESALRELIPVYQQGYTRPLARLGERNLLDYLQREGHFFATVRHRCEPVDCTGSGLKLVYQIESPGRYYLREIRLEGTDKLKKSEVLSSLKTKEARFFGGLPVLKSLPYLGGYGRGLTSSDMLREDAETIRAMMQERGYLLSSVDFKLAFTSDLSDPIVIFNVTEGPYFAVTGIDIEGNKQISTQLLKSALTLKEGEPLAPSVVRNGIAELKDLYASRGYLDTRIEMRVVLEGSDVGRVKYLIQEGELSKIGQIEIAGQTGTDEARIRDFLKLQTGQVLTPTLINHTQRDLYATGAFSEVSVRTLPGSIASQKIVQVHVAEAKPLLFVYGLGYSTEEGPRGLLQLTHNNLFGRLRSGTLQLRSSLRQQLLQARVTDLRTFGSQWSTTLSAFYNRDSDLRPFARKTVSDDGESRSGRSYGVRRIAFFVQAERKLNVNSSVRLRYNYEDVRLFNISNIPDIELARSAVPVRLGILSAGITKDTRDNAIDPTVGWLLSADSALAARWLGGNEQFNRFYGNVQAYHSFKPDTPVLKDTTLAFAARVGLARTFSARDLDGDGRISDAERQLPISERFFAGGATTLRGFRFEMAGPQAILEPRNASELPTLVPVGGSALAIFNFEFRYPLSRSLRLVPFYDLGNVFNKVSNIDWKQMTSTVGLGIRFRTPIGPVGIDYGYLLDPPSFIDRSGGVIRAPRGVVHIRFGQTF